MVSVKEINQKEKELRKALNIIGIEVIDKSNLKDGSTASACGTFCSPVKTTP